MIEKPKIAMTVSKAFELAFKGAVIATATTNPEPKQTEVLVTTFPTQKKNQSMVVIDAITEIISVYDENGNLMV